MFYGAKDPGAALLSFGEKSRETELGKIGILGAKSAIIFPFFYHTFQGFRHWSWDIFAVGIRNLKTFHLTGWLALTGSMVATVVTVLWLENNRNKDDIHCEMENLTI